MGKSEVRLFSPQLPRVICTSFHIAEHYFLGAWNRLFVAWLEWKFRCSATLWTISARLFAFIHVQYLPLVQVVKPEILVVQVVGKVVVEKIYWLQVHQQRCPSMDSTWSHTLFSHYDQWYQVFKSVQFVGPIFSWLNCQHSCYGVAMLSITPQPLQVVKSNINDDI